MRRVLTVREHDEFVEVTDWVPTAPGKQRILMSRAEAEALCRTLAAHLGCEVGPKGWKAVVYESRTDRYPEDGEARKMFLDEGGVWGTYGYQPFATANECAAAVGALSVPAGEEEQPR